MNASMHRRRGVTLVEILVVLGIIGIILAVAAPSMADLMARRRVEMVAAELATNMAYARSEAAIRPTDVFVSFGRDSAGSCYTIALWGNKGGCDCTAGAGKACSGVPNNYTELKTVLVPASTGVSLIASTSITEAAAKAGTPIKTEFAFSAPQMSVSEASEKAVMLSVTGSRVGRMELKVNYAGRVSSCSPDGSITGVVRCTD